MSHYSEIRSRHILNACWLWEAYLLLRRRTARSIYKIELRLGTFYQSDHLLGKIIRGIISAEDWRSKKVASILTFCHHRPFRQLYYCDYRYHIHTV